MLRFRFLLVFALAASASASPPGSLSGPAPELTIYAYDSFLAPGGPGPALFPVFEKRCGCRVKGIAVGDGAQLLSRLAMDERAGSSPAQVAVGVDQALWERARGYAAAWKALPSGYSRIPKGLRVGAPKDGFVPFDYGVLALMVDHKLLKEKGLPVPGSLRDLTRPEWKRNLILEDPRTSSPGLAFVLHVHSALGKGAEAFWHALRPSWLTLAPGWDSAYGLFLSGEAPLVWSYTTSQAYHRAHGDREGRYQAALFSEGNPVQVEGAMVIRRGVKDEARLELGRRFIEFLLEPASQAVIATKNWMLPVIPGTRLPPEFEGLPRPARIGAEPVSASATRLALDEWDKGVGR